MTLTLNEYQQAALRTCGSGMRGSILYSALAIAGEAGEYADEIKKNAFHGHELDREKLVKELGDVLWGVAHAADALRLPLEAIAQANIDKLKARYPNGFESDRSVNRAAEAKNED